MTKTERDELATAIDLIQSLRIEMQTGFTEVRQELTGVRERQAAHLEHHEAVTQSKTESTITKRWVIGVAVPICGVVITALFGLARLVLGT